MKIELLRVSVTKDERRERHVLDVRMTRGWWPLREVTYHQVYVERADSGYGTIFRDVVTGVRWSDGENQTFARWQAWQLEQEIEKARREFKPPKLVTLWEAEPEVKDKPGSRLVRTGPHR